jgi:hypothetical protein
MKLLLANPNATERVTRACAQLARAVALPDTSTRNGRSSE